MARNKHPDETVNLILDVSFRLFMEKGYEPNFHPSRKRNTFPLPQRFVWPFPYTILITAVFAYVSGSLCTKKTTLSAGA